MPGWFSFDGHCYRAYHDSFSWSDAERECHNRNSKLVVITSSTENEFAGSLVHPKSTCTWIGLEVVSGKLHWIGNFKGNFTKWYDGMYSWRRLAIQGKTCVNFHHQSRMWQNSSCSSRCHYICKREGGLKTPKHPLVGFAGSSVMILQEIDRRSLKNLR